MGEGRYLMKGLIFKCATFRIRFRGGRGAGVLFIEHFLPEFEQVVDRIDVEARLSFSALADLAEIQEGTGVHLISFPWK
ncbi:hypothetical protein JTE90_018723 [Oedothorax gibbosus]|uniref:Uncharacterized protein n=1 Tax=Oedothorax gibbosus TaxID=931172 RepID=A0AAV6UJA3_9ARAC|nr:hypothetical protein JTE90_018723 [Oedothorax gibbosus]